MSKNQKLSLGALIVLLVILFVRFPSQKESIVGSVARGQEYQATSTYVMLGGGVIAPSPAATVLFRQIGTGDNTFGSVVVASSSATVARIWNATSTTDVGSTTIANFVAAPANGTYTFDVSAPRGIILEMTSGFNGAYTITYR